MSNLLEQWNEHIVRGNQLSRELEDIEDILEKSKGADICFSSGANGSVFIRVLSPEKMQELRESVVVAIMRTRDDKAAELERLMGIRKPTIINPEFEAAVNSMVDSMKKPAAKAIEALSKVTADPVEEKLTEILQAEAKKIEGEPVHISLTDDDVDDVRRMYQQEGLTQGDIAVHYGVKKVQVNTFIQKHGLFRTSYKKDDGFLDAKVQARQGSTK